MCLVFLLGHPHKPNLGSAVQVGLMQDGRGDHCLSRLPDGLDTGLSHGLCGRPEKPSLPMPASLFLVRQVLIAPTSSDHYPGAKFFFSPCSLSCFWFGENVPSIVDICGFTS